jgi:hypothetical protein
MTSRNAKALGPSPHMRWHAFGMNPELFGPREPDWP